MRMEALDVEGVQPFIDQCGKLQGHLVAGLQIVPDEQIERRRVAALNLLANVAWCHVRLEGFENGRDNAFRKIGGQAIDGRAFLLEKGRRVQPGARPAGQFMLIRKAERRIFP